MAIETGKVLSQQTNTSATQSSSALLPVGDTSNISREFSVTSKPVRVTAYGLIDGFVSVIKVLPPISTTDITACNGIVGKSTEFEKPHRVGCRKVVLCPEQDEIVIDAIGTYKLEYEGNDRASVHVVHEDDPVVTVTNNLRGIEECCV